jgi:hypothetical protein
MKLLFYQIVLHVCLAFQRWFMDQSFALKGALLAMNTTHQLVPACNALMVSLSNIRVQDIALKGVWWDMNTKRDGILYLRTIQRLHFVDYAMTTSKKRSQENRLAPCVRLVPIRLIMGHMFVNVMQVPIMRWTMT